MYVSSNNSGSFAALHFRKYVYPFRLQGISFLPRRLHTLVRPRAVSSSNPQNLLILVLAYLIFIYPTYVTMGVLSPPRPRIPLDLFSIELDRKAWKTNRLYTVILNSSLQFLLTLTIEHTRKLEHGHICNIVLRDY